MATKVAGELYETLTGQLFEIGRQLRQPNGYPFNPEALKLHLQDAIEGRFALPNFPIWKTLTLGRPSSVKAYRAALAARGHNLSGYASEILDKTSVAETETEANLVRVSVAELGFKKPATYREIVSRAKERGLELCPAEVGPKLRLEDDQPCGDYYWIAMEPIAVSDGLARVFCVGRSDGGVRWLNTNFVGDDFR